MPPNDDKPCCSGGPGYATPEMAIKAEKEKLVYVPCIQVTPGHKDYLATICVDPESPDYSKVIHRLPMLHDDDELHHTGWNTCASCHGITESTRDKLILPCLGSSRVYVVDTSEQRQPKHHAVIEPEEFFSRGYSRPHTSHCMKNGDVLLSTMGDEKDENKGGMLIIDGKTWKVKGSWHAEEERTPYGYDFWYQYKFNILISTEFGAPSSFWKGFDPSEAASRYGNSLHFWDFDTKKLTNSVELGPEGMIPLEIRFLHNPDKPIGFVGCALSSTIFKFEQNQETKKWETERVIAINPKSVEGWALPHMPGLITDILVSMDDRFLYFSNWLHGDLRQYDITDPSNPKLVGQVFVGGSVCKGGPVTVTEDKELSEQPAARVVKGRQSNGGPQMLQLSLDGRRIYLTDSLLSPWDRQFYPDMIKNGSVMLQIDVDNVKGGLSVNENFLIDFGQEPGGPVLAHEVRYPGGDCSSDIYLPTDMLAAQMKSGE